MGPSSLIVGIRKLFDTERQRQKQRIKLSLVQVTIDDTRLLMQDNMNNLITRGGKIEELDDRAQELEKSSQLFYLETKTWYQRWWYFLKHCDTRCCFCVPQWWFGK